MLVIIDISILFSTILLGSFWQFCWGCAVRCPLLQRLCTLQALILQSYELKAFQSISGSKEIFSSLSNSWLCSSSLGIFCSKAKEKRWLKWIWRGRGGKKIAKRLRGGWIERAAGLSWNFCLKMNIWNPGKYLGFQSIGYLAKTLALVWFDVAFYMFIISKGHNRLRIFVTLVELSCFVKFYVCVYMLGKSEHVVEKRKIHRVAECFLS